MTVRVSRCLAALLFATAAACGDDETGPSDGVPPEVVLTAPAPGTVLQGTVTLIANASDDHGIAGVRFLVDGEPVEAEDTDPPFAVLWNTADAPDGFHTVTARARDDGGLATTSAPLDVSVLNHPASIELTVTVTGDGDDADGFDVLIDGQLGGTMDGPGTLTLDGLTPGEHHVWLHGVSLFCDPVEAAAVHVEPDATAPLAIEIHCIAGPAGTLLVNGRYDFRDEVALIPVAHGHPDRVGDGFSADVSFDGTMLVVIAQRDLVVGPADRSNLRIVTRLPEDAGGARWVPDGSAISFHAPRDGVIDLFLVDSDGLNVRPLYEEAHPTGRAFAAWAPDGRLAYTVVGDGEEQIWIADGDGSNAAMLTHGRSAAWSPDGAELAFSRVSSDDLLSRIHVIGADGTNERILVEDAADVSVPVWSPDASWMAYSLSVGVEGEAELWAVRVADGLKRKLGDEYRSVYVQDWVAGD